MAMTLINDVVIVPAAADDDDDDDDDDGNELHLLVVFDVVTVVCHSQEVQSLGQLDAVS